MSLVATRAALETALAALSPPLPTVWENEPYTPVTGTPFQRVFMLRSAPANDEMSRSYREQGQLQINLYYPILAGTGAAEARAEVIRAAFYRGRSLVASGVTTTIERTPEVAGGSDDNDWFCVPVRIRFGAPITV